MGINFDVSGNIWVFISILVLCKIKLVELSEFHNEGKEKWDNFLKMTYRLQLVMLKE